MVGKVFHTVVSDKGHLGVQFNHSEALTVIGHRSPYASIKSNDWLERKLVKIYTAYYYKVLLETKGRFWKDNDTKAIAYTKEDIKDGSKTSI